MIAATSFGLPAFIRIFIPGVATVLLLLALVPSSLDLSLSVEGLARLIALALTAGTILFLLDTRIIRLFEGRLLLPAGARNYLSRLAQKRLEELLENKIRPLHAKKTSLEQQAEEGDLTARGRLVEIERELGLLYDRMLSFPIASDGRPFAVWPTHFGNVLASYEYYPEARYGMDSSFYWYRLWAVVDDNTRKEMDAYWAMTQAWMYISAASLFALVVYVISALHLWSLPKMYEISISSWVPLFLRQGFELLANLRLIGRVAEGRSNADVLVSLGLYVVISGSVFWFSYKATLEQLRVSGEFSKAIFDLFRSEIVTQTQEDQEKANWNAAMLSSRYLRGNTILDRKRKGV